MTAAKSPTDDRIPVTRDQWYVSIAAYSLFTGACVAATHPWQLAVFRFLASLGLVVIWLAPETRGRPLPE